LSGDAMLAEQQVKIQNSVTVKSYINGSNSIPAKQRL